MPVRRRALLAAAAAVPAALAGRGARTQVTAEPFPSRPVRMIAPFAPGGPVDVTGRPLALRLGAILGQPVVFENRPGANGIVGTQQVATARPDGHTLLLTTGSFVGNVLFSAVPLPYDPWRDLAPVTLVADGSGMAMVGRPGLPARDMTELVALARARPGALSCAVAGTGNITQLAAEQFRRFTGAELLEVPMPGTGPTLNELLAGNVDVAFVTISIAAPLLREGRLRGYGYTGRRRPAVAPGLPLMAEVGYPDWRLFGMTGMWTTGGTPPDRVSALQRAAAEALRAPEVERLLREGESDPGGMPPEEFAAYLQRELAMQRDLARQAEAGRRG